MIINHNVTALNTLNRLNINNKNTANAMEKLSSGLRINRAGDDSAGLAISEKMRAQIRGLHQAQRNAQDGISLIQTAEGGLGDITNQLQRARELSIQSVNDTLTDGDRQHIQKEIEQIKKGINHIANNTEFNGINLLNDTAETIHTYELNETPLNYNDAKAYAESVGGYLATITSADEQNEIHNLTLSASSGALWIGLTRESGQWAWDTGEPLDYSNWNPGEPSGSGNYVHFYRSSGAWNDVTSSYNVSSVIEREKEVQSSINLHIGANSGDTFQVELTNVRTKALDIHDIDLSTRQGAESAISRIDKALETVSSERSKFGAYQNRLEHVLNTSFTNEMNLTTSESRIRDADMAKQMVALTKNQILSQASQSMFSQASQQPQQVLQLLK